MNAAQIFRPGERIALPYLPILRVENNVAILKKSRFAVGAECGSRHRVRIETLFFVRGGFKIHRSTVYEVLFRAFRVVFKTPYGSYVTEEVPIRPMYLNEVPNVHEFAEKLVREEFGNKVAEVVNVEVREQVKPVDVYVREFKYAEVWLTPDGNILEIKKNYEGDTYFIYEFISETEAKLVDDDRADYVLHIFGHSQGSRASCATIKLIGGDVVWSDIKHTCCRIASSAAAVVIARYGSRFTIAMNDLPYRGCCEKWKIEEWLAEFPPRRVSLYDAAEPAATSELRPEEVA